MLHITDAELDRFILDDAPHGDLTTRSLGLSGTPTVMVFRAGGALVASSTEEAARILARLGCTVTLNAASGTQAAAGDVLLSATGPADAILTGWKVAQTLVEYASGIATSAAGMVAAARAVRPDVVIACTRKTFPGTKAVAIKAIIAGGATPHRLGLSDSILLFPEHRALLGQTTLAEAISRLKRACPEKKVVVEVTSQDEAEAAAAAGADVIQLEKFTPAQTAEVTERVGPCGILIAAAGGVTAANAADYAQAGAAILVSSAPYSAPPVDVKVTISPQ
ncbi:Molybdenum transport system protein ModD [Paramagnetospirillum magnetotacticum MS-1]|uniref:Putative pyrophosphorylase ModD n=1 Tax=Paramagnetospirillum magnetotacticum MS-1 TaxID=272627 RepID=A0A0C2V311_PARME|nr:ModD protein [Paramagnetospirillum magnetotacticum]KIL99476.1 Molybdenum transport system protein ModD [Paramagnetospirillum magnetotacticum MS-1]